MLVTELINGVRHVPRSLQALSCEVDYRGLCTNEDIGLTIPCGGNGQCVVSFIDDQQTAVCNCGQFPLDPTQGVPCNLATPRSCELDGLFWQPNGFDPASQGQNLCQLPRLNCRNTIQCDRTSAVTGYVRGDCYGCELPRGNLLAMQDPGVCVPSVSLTTPSSTSRADALLAQAALHPW